MLQVVVTTVIEVWDDKSLDHEEAFQIDLNDDRLHCIEGYLN